MRGMELMGYLSNSVTLDSIHLINKKHNWKINDKQYKNMIFISYSGRPVVDPDNFSLFVARTTDTKWHIITLCGPNSNLNATFGQ